MGAPRKFTLAQETQIAEEYATTDISQLELAVKSGCSLDTLRRILAEAKYQKEQNNDQL